MPIEPPTKATPPSQPTIQKPESVARSEPRDPADDTARWFLQPNEAKPIGLGVYATKGNEVTAFIEYRDYYAAVAKAITAAVNREHFIYFCDRGFDPEEWGTKLLGGRCQLALGRPRSSSSREIRPGTRSSGTHRRVYWVFTPGDCGGTFSYATSSVRLDSNTPRFPVVSNVAQRSRTSTCARYESD